MRRASLCLAIGAAALSVPVLVDMLFSVSFMGDNLSFVLAEALLLSFLMAIASVVVVLQSPMRTRKSVITIVTIAAIPFVVIGMGFLPVDGILRPLTGLDRL